MRRHELPRNFRRWNSLASAFAIIHPVIKTLRQRVFAHRTPGVVGDVIDIRWKEALIRLMNARGDIRPPEEGLHKRRAIVRAHLQFQISAPRMQTDAVHSFHPAHWIVIAAPNRLRTVFVLLNFKIHWQERGRPMMLRPIELDAARDPRSGES